MRHTTKTKVRKLKNAARKLSNEAFRSVNHADSVLLVAMSDAAARKKSKVKAAESVAPTVQAFQEHAQRLRTLAERYTLRALQEVA